MAHSTIEASCTAVDRRSNPPPRFSSQGPVVTTTVETTTSTDPTSQTFGPTLPPIPTFAPSNLQYQAVPPNPPKTQSSTAGSTTSRPSTRRHQPILIEDPRYKEHEYVGGTRASAFL
jgi:hypothetical protein